MASSAISLGAATKPAGSQGGSRAVEPPIAALLVDLTGGGKGRRWGKPPAWDKIERHDARTPQAIPSAPPPTETNCGDAGRGLDSRPRLCLKWRN